MVEETSEQTITFVLLGETGTGKSTIGNAILNEKVFKQSARLDSMTMETDIKEGISRFGDRSRVVDTPGL